MVNCKLLPHGGYTLLPAVLATVAWLLSLAQDGCDYSRVTGPIVNDVTGSTAIPYLEMGFTAYREPQYNPEKKQWEVQYTGTCLTYPSDKVQQDNFWNVAKVFAFLALVLGGGGALFLWFSSCFVFSRSTWRWAGYEIFLAFVFQCLSFLWFKTELCQVGGGNGDGASSSSSNDCALFYGSKSNIGASALFFVSALLVLLRYPAPKRNEEQESPEIVSAAHDDVSFTNVSPEEEEDELELPVEGDSEATLPGESPVESRGKRSTPLVETKETDAEIV